MSNLIRRAVFVIVFLESYPLGAQVLPFRNFTSRDGLLTNYTLALCCDSSGYLWVGSNDGVSRYDGTSFINYTVANGLAFSRVTCLMESRLHPGTLWIGTNGGGVSRFENKQFKTYRVGPTTWTNSIGSIDEDYAGHVWVTSTEGVYRLNDSSFVRLAISLPHSDLLSVLALPDSSVWIITDHRIFSYSPATQATHVVPISSPPDVVFQACSVGRNGAMWLATSAGQILIIKNEEVVERIATGTNLHTFLIFDARGNLWAGTGEGMLRIESEREGTPSRRVTHFTAENGVADPLVVHGVFDREGDLWLAYSSHGIARLGDYSISTYPLNTMSYPPNNSTALSDRNDHVWVCSDGGLMEFWNDAAKGWIKYRHDEIKKRHTGNLPISISMDQDRTFWVVEESGRICQYRVRSSANSPSRLSLLKEFRPGKQFPSAVPMFVFCDDNGLLWCSMANNRGIFLLNPQKRRPFLRQYTTADGMPDMSVRAIFEDRHGNLWFGGYGEGLTMLPSEEPLAGRFRRFTTDQGLPNNAIRAISEDSLGTIWVGTRYGGLAYYQDSLLHPVSLNEGLLSTAVWCMARGLHNHLWIGTQLGMQSLQPSVHAFSTNQDWDVEPVYACGQTSRGILWFVSPAGLALRDASLDQENTVPPPVHIRDFAVNGVPFPTSGSFELASNEDNCAIEVAGVSLHDGENIQYQYRLLGVNNEDWHAPSTNRTFVFASLSPGTYTFMVRALNTSGVASSMPAVLRFTIRPPFWKQWWFGGGILLCIILLTVFIVRIRLSRLLAIERLRAGIATDLHDDIGSGLTRIAILSDVAYSQVQSGRRREGSRSDESAEVLGALDKVRTTARGLIETMSDVVWAIDPTHDTFERLVQRLRSFAYELCEGKNIKLRFHSADEVSSAKMSSEGMRNVLLLSKEALTNIAKHSHCTAAEIALSITDRRLVIEITDDGKGFDASAANGGNGLVNMRKRTNLAGASFVLHSEANKGTRIVATFPLMN